MKRVVVILSPMLSPLSVAQPYLNVRIVPVLATACRVPAAHLLKMSLGGLLT